MREGHLGLLACPRCAGALTLREARERSGERVLEGTLACACGGAWEIRRGVPRFVPSSLYAENFGFQWNRHARTQLDSESGVPISETRFFEETRWPRALPGETILEVACGSGRFTEQALGTGALVVSIDMSSAVDACYAAHGARDNVLILQADLYALPFRDGTFDRLFCLGMLQHTPDVPRAFAALPRHLKSGGKLAVDVYRRQPWWKYLWMTRYWVRPATRRVPPASLYRFVRFYTWLLWPLARLVNKLPRGRSLNRVLLLSDHRGLYPLSEANLFEWSVLDTFDYLSATYDQPQTLETVRGWFAGFRDVEVHYGHNGIEGRGTKA
jgi:SAM-dependent methyltransferase